MPSPTGPLASSYQYTPVLSLNSTCVAKGTFDSNMLEVGFDYDFIKHMVVNLFGMPGTSFFFSKPAIFHPCGFLPLPTVLTMQRCSSSLPVVQRCPPLFSQCRDVCPYSTKMSATVLAMQRCPTSVPTVQRCPPWFSL